MVPAASNNVIGGPGDYQHTESQGLEVFNSEHAVAPVALSPNRLNDECYHYHEEEEEVIEDIADMLPEASEFYLSCSSLCSMNSSITMSTSFDDSFLNDSFFVNDSYEESPRNSRINLRRWSDTRLGEGGKDKPLCIPGGGGGRQIPRQATNKESTQPNKREDIARTTSKECNKYNRPAVLPRRVPSGRSENSR